MPLLFPYRSYLHQPWHPTLPSMQRLPLLNHYLQAQRPLHSDGLCCIQGFYRISLNNLHIVPQVLQSSFSLPQNQSLSHIHRTTRLSLPSKNLLLPPAPVCHRHQLPRYARMPRAAVSDKRLLYHPAFRYFLHNSQ